MDFSPSATLEKMRKYCAYQERSHKDVEQKMWELEIPKNQKDDILLKLMQENFLNEERFARAYAKGKFNIKKWGKVKIINGLKKHRVQKTCIRLALSEIDGDLYLETLQKNLEKKNAELKEKNQWKRKSALYRFAAQRGFEASLINDVLKELEGRGRK